MSPEAAARITGRSSTRSSAGPGRGLAAMRSVAATVLTPVVLVVLLLGGVRSSAIGVAGLVALVGVLLVAVRGFEQSALVVLTGAFALAPMDRLRPVPGIDFVSASDLLMFLGFGLLSVVLIARHVRPGGLFVAGASGVFVSGLLVCLASPVPVTSLNVLVRLVIGALLLPLILMMWAPGKSVLRVLAGAYVVGNVGNVVYGAVAGEKNFEGRIIGYSEHPNVLGLCALLGLALVPFLLRENGRSSAWVWVVLGAVCAYGVWASGSRAALLVGAFVGLMYPVMARSIRIGLVLAGGGIVAFYVVGNAILSGDNSTNAIGRLLGNGSASASDQVREINARFALEQFRASPYLGSGFSEGTLDAHNVYLQVAASGGIITLVFFVLLLAGVIRQPFALGPSYRLLVLPGLAYALIAPITSVIWDRYIWCVLALPFLIALDRDDNSSATNIPTVQEPVS